MSMIREQSPIKKLIWAIIGIALTALLIWGIQWATYARPPLPEAIEALENDDFITVTQDPWLAFYPAEAPPVTGLILYPGGRIDPRGYAPLARAIASEGYLVVIPEMPINMAVFDPNVADQIIAHYPAIGHWAIAGHSVGGTMAAQYTARNPETIEGLAIWSSYPADSTDISDLDIPVLSIHGSREVTVTDASVGERAHLLPADTTYISIPGGDHHQFGSYKITPEEHLATTSRATQQQQIVAATLALLSKVAGGLSDQQ